MKVNRYKYNIRETRIFFFNLSWGHWTVMYLVDMIMNWVFCWLWKVTKENVCYVDIKSLDEEKAIWIWRLDSTQPQSKQTKPDKTECYQTWLNSAKVAYFKTPWWVKNGGVRHHKCGLFLQAPRFWLNMAKIPIFIPWLGVSQKHFSLLQAQPNCTAVKLTSNLSSTQLFFPFLRFLPAPSSTQLFCSEAAL